MNSPAPADWRQSAACRDTGDLFFPEGTGDLAKSQAEEALAVCRRCPVRATCLDWALSHAVAHGVWGGTTEQGRPGLGSALTAVAPRLCQSGRHLRTDGGAQCPGCKQERERGRTRVRDQAAYYAARVARLAAREAAA